MSDEWTRILNDDQRYEDQKSDEAHERDAQQQTEKLARQFSGDSRALSALYGVEVNTDPFDDLLDERYTLGKRIAECGALEEHLQEHFYDYLYDLELVNEGAIHEIQLFAKSLLEDLDINHPAAKPVLETLNDFFAAAKRCF